MVKFNDILPYPKGWGILKKMAKKDMDKLLKKLREEEGIENLIKQYGLSISLARILIVFYQFKISPKDVAQKMGVHLSTINRYYAQFGMMLESEFNSIVSYYFEKGGLNSSQA